MHAAICPKSAAEESRSRALCGLELEDVRALRSDGV